ncbi:MAG TPA: hypothetical protein VKU01_10150 [Bryobacteraceae bacterium]|nr:hypothetical protein [Bryobacteraceae bacterium]
MSVQSVFMKSGNLKRVCELTLTDGSTVTVEPYAIFISPRGRQQFLWFQLSSSKPEDRGGWKSPETGTVKAAKMMDPSFTIRTDYQPFDKGLYPFVNFSIPTHDGRQRWMDTRKDLDKQTLQRDFNKPSS